MLGATAVVIVATGQSLANIVILSITIVAASFVGLGAIGCWRRWSPRCSASRPVVAGGRTRAALEREKALVLRSIKELEFDSAMGKVSQADFDEMCGRLRRRAMGLMRPARCFDTGYREQIEREIAALVHDAGAGRKSTRPHRGLPGCGTHNDSDARFCKQCGTSIKS